MTWLLALVVLATPQRVRIPQGEYQPFYREAAGQDGGRGTPQPPERVPAFELDVHAVTADEFVAFARANPKWRRSQVARVFADPGYLDSWRGDLAVASGANLAPVTEVSWFAANAYCRWKGARLPTAAQWERAAAEEGDNARESSRQILEWYGRPTPAVLPPANDGLPNRHGVRGLHNLIWEWVLDFNDAMISDEGRASSAPGDALFCGSGAAAASNPSDYATFMRMAFRSSLKANYTVRNLGFRCAR